VERRRARRAVAILDRAAAALALAGAERSLAAIERDLADARRRVEALGPRGPLASHLAHPAALLESDALDGIARSAALRELEERLRRLGAERELGVRGLDAAKEALARAVRAAQILSPK
jgi:hypothetical protein